VGELTKQRHLRLAAEGVRHGDCIVDRHKAAVARTAGETDASPELTAVLQWSGLHSHVGYKRLEEEKFKWPVHLPPCASDAHSASAPSALESSSPRPPVVELTEDQFLWLLEGLDLKHLKPHRALEYRSVL
jgi:hypothetical protein